MVLEREPDNRHDRNAILILTESGDELGYVPREDAKVMAPLLDAGGWVDATVKKLLETADGHTLPVVVTMLYRQGVESRSASAESLLSPRKRVTEAALSDALFGRDNRPITPGLTPRVKRNWDWMPIAIVLTVALILYLLIR